METSLKDKGSEHVDFVVVRGNSEVLSVGAGGVMKKGIADDVAIQNSINTRKGVETAMVG